MVWPVDVSGRLIQVGDRVVLAKGRYAGVYAGRVSAIRKMPGEGRRHWWLDVVPEVEMRHAASRGRPWLSTSVRVEGG